MMDRIVELRKQLEYYNYLYYVKNAPVISDQKFDELMHELERLEAEHPEMFDPNSPTQRVGNDTTNEFVQVAHKYGMMSLANTYSEQEIRDFDERVRKGIGGDEVEYVCELKYDGTSISLRYEEGKLQVAVTRGDGVKGDDVTTNVRTIRTVPLHMQGEDYPAEFEIRGEILMPFAVFNRLNEDEIAQIADGMLRKVAERMKDMEISMTWTEAAKKHLAKAGFDPVYGARPLRRAVTNEVEDLVAEESLEGRIGKGSEVVLDAENDKLVLKTKGAETKAE